MRIISSMVAICVLAGASLQSASAQSMRKGIGWGSTSCGKWSAERKNPSSFFAKSMEWWAVGFVSGSNWANTGPDHLASVDAAAITSWLDNYCKRNPLETFPKAAAALASELAQRANR
jgi:hypothetical protein